MDDGLVRSHLLPGERIQWSGQPGQGLLFMPSDIALVPFSLLWGGFAIFWETTVFRTGGPSFFLLFGAAFVAVGLYMIAGRFLVDAWLRGGMQYAVTDSRILIARSAPFKQLKSVSLSNLPEAELKERSDGRGTIRFGAAMPMWSRRNMGGWTPALDPMPQFLVIENAQQVFDLIQRSTRRPADSQVAAT
jgi:hypothetical protein